MLLKWIGGLCIILGCSYVGFRMASNQRREVQYLQMLQQQLEFMVCELQYRLTPLPDLCRKTAGEGSGALRKVFYTLAQELEDQISPNAERCMHSAISKCGNLPEITRNCLILLGKSLGRFNLDGQIKGLEAVCQDCKRHLEHLQHNKEERLRSYQTLGICAGAGIAILFI